ncbi:hypothetical protein [uncultured Dokdonia sp.]|uniref:hypothetical protein n=1 Tax=uncultured Dokdonia sp. TaxID=575653 RepID=UPI002605A580|nr:hypothetical protein [uncultured Dokdonia sp.]
MNIFPIKERTFKLFDTQSETLERLKRRTEKSKNLTSQHTDKTFRGIIDGNQFKLISSVVGKGALCVMTGEIQEGTGFVKVEIHKVFKILFSILLCFPPIGITLSILIGAEEYHPIFILVALLQVLMIRYIFIGFAFRAISRASLNRLRDVLDFEWTTNYK